MSGARTLVAAIVFAVAVAAFSRIPLLPDIGLDLTLTAGEIGLLTTTFGLGRLLMDLPAGRLADAVGPEPALVGSGIVLALACALLAAAQTFAQALVATGLIGCASALTNTTGMYAFATATGAQRRGASMAIYTTALITGQMVGPVVGGVLGSLAGWRAAIAFAGAIGIVVALACLVWRRRLRGTDRRPRPDPAPSAINPVAPPAPPAPSRRELVALAATPFATFFALAGLTQTLVPLLGADELSLSASTIGIAIGVGAGFRFVVAWIAGITSDRTSRKSVLLPSLWLMVLGAVALALPVSLGAWLVGILLLAIGSSGISVAAAALADAVPVERLGGHLGVFRLVGDFGLMIGPAAVGFLYQVSGQGPAAGLAAAIFVVAAVLTALWLRGDSTLDVASAAT